MQKLCLSFQVTPQIVLSCNPPWMFDTDTLIIHVPLRRSLIQLLCYPSLVVISLRRGWIYIEHYRLVCCSHLIFNIDNKRWTFCNFIGSRFWRSNFLNKIQFKKETYLDQLKCFNVCFKVWSNIKLRHEGFGHM